MAQPLPILKSLTWCLTDLDKVAIVIPGCAAILFWIVTGTKVMSNFMAKTENIV